MEPWLQERLLSAGNADNAVVGKRPHRRGQHRAVLLCRWCAHSVVCIKTHADSHPVSLCSFCLRNADAAGAADEDKDKDSDEEEADMEEFDEATIMDVQPTTSNGASEHEDPCILLVTAQAASPCGYLYQNISLSRHSKLALPQGLAKRVGLEQFRAVRSRRGKGSRGIRMRPGDEVSAALLVHFPLQSGCS